MIDINLQFFGGRGSSSGEISRSNRIREQIISDTANSKLKGLARQARNNEGKFGAMSEATAIKYADIKGLDRFGSYERNGNTIVYFSRNNKARFYANKSDSPEIRNLLKNQRRREEKEVKEEKIQRDIMASKQGARTTTYDVWQKRNKRKFDAWFYGSSK